MIQSDPFKTLDTFFGRMAGLPVAMSDYPMAMDAYRRGNDVWVHIDLPGVNSDSVELSVERGVLTVTGQRSVARTEGDRYYLAERPTGTFRRQVRLGDGLDSEAIEADLHDGVLTLRIPVAERAQPRRIPIELNKHTIDASALEAPTPAS